MNKDLLQSIVRSVLNLLAGFLVAHGVLKADSLTSQAPELIAGAVATALSVVWSKRHQTAMKVEAGTTIITKDQLKP